MMAARSGQTEAVLALLRTGAIRSVRDKRGKTALDFALEHGQTDMLNALRATDEAK